MEPPSDFKELLALFAARNVEYVVVGGYALAHHGAPRYTGDIDLYVRPSGDNAAKVLDALSEFGFADVGLTKTDLTTPGYVVQLGVPPARVDLVTSIDGVDWQTAWAGRQEGSFGDMSVHFIGRSELIKNKRAVGRKQDLADLEALGEQLD